MAPKKSTIVRSPLGGRAALRGTFRLLEATAPPLGARLAERLWFRLPPRPTAGSRTRRSPVGGRELVVTWEDLTVHGVAYGPERAPTAYLVHGWGGWWQQLGGHVQPLVEAGYRVVAYDAPSHGSSPPGRHGARSSTILEMAEALSAVARHEGAPDLVVAHSIGAPVSLWSGVDGTVARAYAFLAPASTVASMVGWFRSALAVGPRSADELVRRVERRVGHPVSDFDTVRLAGRLVTTAGMTPALLAVHDPADPETPVSGSTSLAAAWPGASLHLVDGLGHRRLLWDRDVVATVADFAGRQSVVPGTLSA